jgi:hypothetical protein
MAEKLCCCTFWTGRVAVHRRREGCTPETQPAPDTFVAEVAASAVAAAQPLTTALAESIDHVTRTLDAAWKSVLQGQHRR